MARRHDAPSRSDLTERTGRHREALHERSDDIEMSVSDIEVTRETLDSLGLDGLAEWAEDAERAIEGARDVSLDEVTQKAQELAEEQGEIESHEHDLEDRSDSTTSDLDKVSDADPRIHSDAVRGELATARDDAAEAVAFLKEEIERAREAREESKSLHDAHMRRVEQAERP